MFWRLFTRSGGHSTAQHINRGRLLIFGMTLADPSICNNFCFCLRSRWEGHDTWDDVSRFVAGGEFFKRSATFRRGNCLPAGSLGFAFPAKCLITREFFVGPRWTKTAPYVTVARTVSRQLLPDARRDRGRHVHVQLTDNGAPLNFVYNRRGRLDCHPGFIHPMEFLRLGRFAQPVLAPRTRIERDFAGAGYAMAFEAGVRHSGFSRCPPKRDADTQSRFLPCRPWATAHQQVPFLP